MRARCPASIDGGRCAGLERHGGDHYPNARDRHAKTCGCGRAFTVREWRALRLVGHQDDFNGGELELRDCVGCLSTIAIEIPNRQDGDRATHSLPEREAPTSAVRLCPVGVF